MQRIEYKELLSKDLLDKINSCRFWDMHECKDPLSRWEFYSDIVSMHIGSFKKREPLLDVYIAPVHAGFGDTYTIEAPYSGIWTIEHSESKINKHSTIRYFEDEDDFAQYLLSSYCKYAIQKDEFDGISNIEWQIADHVYANGLRAFLNGNITLAVSADMEGYYLHFKWHPDWRKKKDMGIGDNFIFLFDNNEKYSFVAKAKPIKDNHDYLYYTFNMPKTVIDAFEMHKLSAVKVSFANGDAPVVLKADNTRYILFQAWFRKNIELYEGLGYKIEEDVAEESTPNDNSCYVYLMFDEANGYYKIGISNNPEYREHTLQSEKPTITLIKAKDYPTRAIAEAFEAALHKAYESKRLRGEWFKLDALDVGILLKALS